MDVTERRRAADTLEAAKTAAEESNRQKDHFLAVLGHELRNPLAPIGNAVALLKRLGPPEPGSQRLHDMIERQVAHMTRLIDDLLDVSRISMGKIALRREELDLTEVVQRAVEDHRSLLDAHGLALRFAAPGESVGILGDGARITQVVGNLLVNACKFTDRGGCVDVSVEAAGGRQAVIRVRDTGIGIDRETLRVLFEPFAQADRSMHRSGGGLGLGLALVKGLVELHGGHVQANSAGTGLGAEFVVSLPGVVRRASADDAGSGGDGRASRPQRILIVEDNDDAAESLKLLLELSGHAVEVAHSGPEGLEKARLHKPEVVLCDIGLPGMNGYEVATAIRKIGELGSVFLVAMTGYGLDEDRQRALAAGFDRHLTKPADPSVLERLLASLADPQAPSGS
jgi:CheY-like chemotaxis protein